MTINWSSTNATSCAISELSATGLATSGSRQVTPTAAGQFTYTVQCTGAGGSASQAVTLAVSFAVSVTTQAQPPQGTVVAPSPALTGSLSRVRSFEYVIAESTASANINETIGASSADLVILNMCLNGPSLNRAVADPSGNKLIFGYIDIGEVLACWAPSLFSGGTLPSWFGNVNPGYPGLYTVQYWNPAWKTALYALIDKNIAMGFDGIFVDVLTADSEWSAGNIENNPVYANATADLATLLTDMRNYIKQTYPAKTVYLMGNNPTKLAVQYPDSVKSLDAIFNESVYYTQDPNDGTVSKFMGNSLASFVSSLIPAYSAIHVPIFGNDYPSPLSDPAASLLSFNYYSNLGWIPSVTTPAQKAAIFTTGPFMFMATPGNSTVTGRAGFTNYLSGGLTTNATLNGADGNDYFIGGPGKNTINGGAGNDTIYAHPEYAAQKGKLTFSLSSTIKGSVTTRPSVAISINGQAAVPVTQITAPNTSNVQVFAIDVSALGAITSAVITVSGTNFVDQSNYSNVEIDSVMLNGLAVDRAAATYSNGGAPNGFAYSNNGTVTFPASALALASPFAADTSDVIDGGTGTNTVFYRGPSSNYTMTKQANGSWTVTSASTAEGPDTLTNVQSVTFTDKTVALN